MKKMIRSVVALLIACAWAGAVRADYSGSSFTVSAWKGETVYVTVGGRSTLDVVCVHGAARDGISLALGYMDTVPYLTEIGGSHFATRYDILKMFPLGSTPDRTKLDRVMLRVMVSPETKAGEYVFGPVTVRVVDRVLPQPADRKYFLDLWQHPWAVSRYFNVKPFSKEHYAKMEPVWRAFAEVGQKALTVTLLDLPWNHQCYDGYGSMIGRVKKDDGTWVFDYSIFDEYVEFGRKCGIGPDIACYTMCPWGFYVRWKNEKCETVRIKAMPGTPEFEEYWGDFLVDFAKHLKEKGWYEDTYIAMDERAPEDVSKIVAFIDKKVPGMKVAMAGNRKPSEFKGVRFDNYCQYLSDVTPEFLTELDERRAKGYKTTFYVCCIPARPNTFMDSPDGEGFWLGAYPALSGFDGFLRWAGNSWPCDPYKNASFGEWKAGDTYFVYPNGELSERLIDLRAGIIASEKMRILKEAGLFKKEISDLAAQYDYKKALDGKLDMKKFRQTVQELVNR